jgi:putative transferase (TIGR04331 family)
MGCTELKETARYLITTSDEFTWKFDRPVLFLGEWCCLYNRRHLWEQMDAIVARPYGLGIAQKDADYAEARALEQKLFPEFFSLLNQQHGLAENTRYWQILLGHWFRRAINVLLNRVRTLQQCLANYSISGVTFYPECTYALAPSDSYSAIWAFSDTRWNQELNTAILRSLITDRIQTEILPVNPNNQAIGQYQLSLPASLNSPTQKIKVWLLKRIIFESRRLCRNQDALIINSYLSKTTQIKLQVACGQWPQIWQSPELVIDEPLDLALRSSLTMSFTNKDTESLEYIARQLLFSLLPICYLEGFNSLRREVLQLTWPSNPRFIFTSNSFDTDEIFKLWTADKVSRGANYFVGQHGNNYGTYRYANPSIEELTADKFFTWGWNADIDTCKYVPAFIFKKSTYKKRKCNPAGGLLLIEQHLDHRVNTWDNTEEFKQYFQDQQVFVQKLNADPRESLTIRLHCQAPNLQWNEEARWTDWDPALKLESGFMPVDSLISDSRLIVHSYDSTGILETLSANIPTLAFWQHGFDHLRDSAIPFYKLLFDVGIIHFSPITTASMVNQIWENVDSWWQKDHVQQARSHFCDQYAKLTNSPVKDLIPALINQCNL